MNKNDYIHIQAFMVSDLKLSGNRLIIYALIHGYCKDGIHEFICSLKYLCEWTNLSRNTVISVLKSLVDEGLIIKREFTVNNVKSCAYRLGSAEIAPLVQKLDGGSAKTAPNNINNNINKEIDTNVSKESNENFVERMYKLYPTKCPVRNITTGKSYKDKQRIKALLKHYSMNDIEKVFKKEINDKLGKHPLKNLSTFLNNFPDPNDLFSIANMGYPQSVDDVKTEDIQPTFAYFQHWVANKMYRVWENLRGRWPNNEAEYKQIAEHTKGGVNGLCYVVLVFNRDGWDEYKDDRGFVFTYLNYIKANGLYKE